MENSYPGWYVKQCKYCEQVQVPPKFEQWQTLEPELAEAIEEGRQKILRGVCNDCFIEQRKHCSDRLRAI